jgi:N,N'-diacetyllegionaminate synthase
LVSIGGIPFQDVTDFFDRHRPGDDQKLTVLYGYQAEPTPIDRNNLYRVVALRDTLGIDIGFMDHADGDGGDEVTLSAMALSLGVTVFEKHITLDRSLELEDFGSALAANEFGDYCASLRRLSGALGNDSLALVAEEQNYCEKASKRVLATHDLAAGTTITAEDVTLLRPAEPGGLFRAADAIGRTLRTDVDRNMPIDEDNL